MTTTSLRNSLHRRNHKERGQLANRKKYGLLEKHKDYVLRARDYHSKQDRLTRLKQKATERNKDEFYFGMNKERTKGGVHIKDRGNEALPVDIVKVLKTQDENYIRTMRASNIKKIDRLKARLTTQADLIPGAFSDDHMEEDGVESDDWKALVDSGIVPGTTKQRKSAKSRSPKHIVFVNTRDQAKEYIAASSVTKPKTTAAIQQSSSPVDLGWILPQNKGKSTKGKSKEVEVEEDEDTLMADVEAEHAKTRSSLIRELAARLKRSTQLGYAQREFEMQRALMGKGGRRKISGVSLVEGGNDGIKFDEDEEDDRRTRKKGGSNNKVQVDEKTWKPRVYKWRFERKR